MKLRLLFVIILIIAVITKRKNKSNTNRIKSLEKKLQKEKAKVMELSERLKSIVYVI
jgi:hypothetical protein